MEQKNLIEGTCPECRGPLTEVQDGGITEFRCLVGHRYSPEALLQSHYEVEERALWAAIVALEEVPTLVKAVAPHVSVQLRETLEHVDGEKREQARQVRDVVENLKAYFRSTEATRKP